MKLLPPLCLMLFAGLAGCAATGDKEILSTAAMSMPARVNLAEAPAASLFPGDQAVLTNDEIARIFATKIGVPEAARIAVVRFGGAPAPFWSEESAHLNQQSLDDLTTKLKSAKRVKTVLVVPTMLMPRQTTIPYLRETAARVQADLVLVYRSWSQSYQKSRFLKRDETRSYCTVEAALLDTRSGIVIFTARASEDFYARRADRDLDFAETVGRSEQQATGKALAKVGDDVAGFLSAGQ